MRLLKRGEYDLRAIFRLTESTDRADFPAMAQIVSERCEEGKWCYEEILLIWFEPVD